MSGSEQHGGDDARSVVESAEDLFENAPCGYLSAEPDGTLLRVNATFLRWTGYRREDLVGVKRFQDLLSVGGRIYHETHYAPMLQMQGTVREIAVDIVGANGDRLPVLVNSVLVRDREGAPQLVRTTVFDARERKLYEGELLAARDRERVGRERIERLQAGHLPPVMLDPGAAPASTWRAARRHSASPLRDSPARRPPSPSRRAPASCSIPTGWSSAGPRRSMPASSACSRPCAPARAPLRRSSSRRSPRPPRTDSSADDVCLLSFRLSADP
jgi:PAS domain S-box-containing protein